MRQLRVLALAMVAVSAFGAIVAASAEAEGPFFRECIKENGAKECTISQRLSKEKSLTVSATKEFVLGTAAQKIKCTALAAPKAVLIPTAEGTAGSSEEQLTFKNCTVSGNNKEGKECKVEKEEITTNVLINTLDKENEQSTKGEKLLVSFRPKEGKVFVKVKFTPAGNCILPETAIELAAGATLGVAGVVDNEAQENVLLEEPSETLGIQGLIKFPETLLKTEWVEEGKKVKEIKEGLVAFGKAVTSFTGHALLELTGGKVKWGVFGK
jgi:hypothetical protein